MGGVPRGGGYGGRDGDADDGTSATTSSAGANSKGCMASVPSSRSSIRSVDSAKPDDGESESIMELDLEEDGAAAAESGGEGWPREGDASSGGQAR
jgi:hypothetical protein